MKLHKDCRQCERFDELIGRGINLNQKHYLCYVKEERQCSECKEIKPFSEFYKNTTSQSPRSQCKPCQTAKFIRLRQEKRLDGYRECVNEDCGKLLHKRWKIEVCPICQSELEDVEI